MNEHGREAEHNRMDVHLHFHVDASILGFFLKLDRLNERIVTAMTQLDDLNASVATLTADFNTYKTDVGTKVQALQDQITVLQNQNPALDLTPVIGAIKDLDNTVKGADAEVNTAPAA